jgi:hypothetical protein
MSKLLRIETVQLIPFVVRIVELGERYGCKNYLVYGKEGNGPQPLGDVLVEFYDARYDYTEYGQFVARYSRSALLRIRESGLLLNDKKDAWQIDADTMADIRQWLLSH